MRDLYELETTPDGAGDGATGEPVETVEPEAPPSPAAEWFDSPEAEEWFQTRLQRQQFEEYQQQQAQSQQPSIDWLSDEDRAQLDRYIDSRIGPATEFQQQLAYQEAEERARDILADNATRHGDFDLDLARLRADTLLPQMQQRYGHTAKAAEAALEAAANQQRQYEQQMMKKGEEQYVNQLSTLSNAPRVPAAAGAPANGVHVTPEGGDERDLVRRYFPTTR